MATLYIRTWSDRADWRAIDAFFRRPIVPRQAEDTARAILRDVEKDGDRAVARYARQFDGATLKPSAFRVGDGEIARAGKAADAAFRKAAREADQRVTRFSRAGLRKNWRIASPGGGVLGEQFTPLDRVGAYIPGGASPLVSTSIMTVTLARVAGVREIVACTPCDSSGAVNPYVLYALNLAGATEIYRLGGVQAIGAMAYGTKTIARVQKIVGPGNVYVTAAKRLVYGHVDLDLVAGPSEVAVVADSTANPRHVAMDLLSQLEHGTGDEKALLITTSSRIAREVAELLPEEAGRLARGAWLKTVLAKNVLLLRVRGKAKALAAVNAFAPEHLELMVKNARSWLPGIRNAGAVFLGPFTPESAGDFAAGPSHVLPTGGTAAVFSGLTVDTFRKRTSVIGFTRKDLEQVLPVIEAFGRVEELDAHAKSARIRLESP